MAKTVPGDIDLTLKMDFSKEESIPHSVSLPKEKLDKSYKRYNQYKREESFTSTVSDWSYFDSDPNFNQVTTFSFTTSSPITNSTLELKLNSYWDSFVSSEIVEVEERVCWRKLFKDPRVFEQQYTADEWIEKLKNWNFPLGSKQDRINAVYEKELRSKSDYGYDNVCECCGRRYNPNNCLSHFYGLCSSCNDRLNNDFDLESVSLG